MARQKTKPDHLRSTCLNVTLTRGLLERLDREVEALQRAHPGQPVTRSQVVRHCLDSMLEDRDAA